MSRKSRAFIYPLYLTTNDQPSPKTESFAKPMLSASFLFVRFTKHFMRIAPTYCFYFTNSSTKFFINSKFYNWLILLDIFFLLLAVHFSNSTY